MLCSRRDWGEPGPDALDHGHDPGALESEAEVAGADDVVVAHVVAGATAVGAELIAGLGIAAQRGRGRIEVAC